jgi:hypothetical protein
MTDRTHADPVGREAKATLYIGSAVGVAGLAEIIGAPIIGALIGAPLLANGVRHMTANE